MGVFYRNQRVEVQYHTVTNAKQTVIYDHANQVEIEKVTENGPFFLCIKFMKNDVLTIDRYSMNDLIRFRLSAYVPKKAETSAEEVEEGASDEDYNN